MKYHARLFRFIIRILLTPFLLIGMRQIKTFNI